ncbi:MAG: nitrilase-related carbon-nitrogen hydrolase, partial [Planctomycetota bacterium]
MRVACLQLDPRVGQFEENREGAYALVQQAARAGAELALLPEMWPTSFCAEVDAPVWAASETSLEAARGWTREFGLSLAGSAYGPGTGGRPSNRFHYLEDGVEVGGYDKGHLFSPTAEHLSFTAGDAPPEVIPSRFGPLHGIVCYDLRFPHWVRPAQRAGSRVMLVVAQWPHPRAAQWRGLVIGRAIEGQCYVVACNRRGSEKIGRRQMALDFPGASLIVDPLGNVLAEGSDEDPMIQAELDLE